MSDNDEFEEINNGVTYNNGLPNNATGSRSMAEEVTGAEEAVEADEAVEAVEAVKSVKPEKAMEEEKPAKLKAVLSDTQKEMQRKRKEKLAELQKIYDERFSNIPKDERPKAKAYYAVSLIAAKDPDAKLEEILKKEREAYDDKKAGIKRPRVTRKNKVHHEDGVLTFQEGVSLLPLSVRLDVHNSLEEKMKALGNNNAMTRRIKHSIRMMSITHSRTKTKTKRSK